MILLDSQCHELGEIESDLDVEIGTTEDSTNDFEFTNNRLFSKNTAGFYIPGTEIGGLIEYSNEKTDEDVATLRGFSWRGLLSQAGPIMAPAGSDYRIVSGEANTVIASLMSGVLGDFFTVSSADSGCTISSYQFPLYINYLDGIEGMLEAYGYRLKISADKIASNQPIQVLLEAVEAQLVSGTFNSDNGIPMAFETNNMGINHLICGGSGELQQRMIVHLYIDNNGNVSQTPYYTGLKERTQFFDYPNAESADDLIAEGTKELLNLASYKKLSMEAPEDYELEVGDLIQGVFPDGTIIQSPIVKKIYKISDGIVSEEYRIKGEE